MDASRSPAAEHGEQLPRRAYFGAEDRAPLEPHRQMPGSGPTRQTMAATKRQNLAENLIKKADAVAVAVKTARAFDVTGNIPQALPHLGACVAELITAHRDFAEDVEEMIKRHARRQRMIAGLESAALDSAGAPLDMPLGGARGFLQNIELRGDAAILAECLAARTPALAALDAAEETNGAPAAPKPGPRP